MTLGELPYLYIIYHPVTSEPFYVGKGTGDRAEKHLCKSSNKNKHKHNIIQKYLKINNPPIIKKMYFDTEDEVYHVEEFLTHHWGLEREGGILTNVFHGGKGGAKGRKHSEASLEKMRLAHNGQIRTKEATEKTRQKLIGKPRSQETRNKISIGNKGKPKSKEHVAASVLTKKQKRLENPNYIHPLSGKHCSEETKEKIRKTKLINKIRKRI